MTRVKLIFQFDRYKGYVDVDYDGEVSSIIHDPELITAVAEAKYSDLNLKFLDDKKKFKIRLHDGNGNNIYYLGKNNGEPLNHLITQVRKEKNVND